LTGPGDIRVRFAKHTAAGLVAELAALRPRPGAVAGYATAIALRELGRRVQFPGGQLERPGELIVPLVTGRAPGLLTLYGVGPDIAAMLLAAAGDHPGRLRSEAAWAHLCATAPIPASSGKVTRHRLNPGGDRQANHALWRIVITRMSSHPPTRAYAGRRTKQGRPEKGDHPLPEALRRPAGLPSPAPGRRLTLTLRGRPDPIIGCRTRAGLRTIRRPSPDPPDLQRVT
jgi:transposase